VAVLPGLTIFGAENFCPLDIASSICAGVQPRFCIWFWNFCTDFCPPRFHAGLSVALGGVFKFMGSEAGFTGCWGFGGRGFDGPVFGGASVAPALLPLPLATFASSAMKTATPIMAIALAKWDAA
jgi:hypothetical protein